MTATSYWPPATAPETHSETSSATRDDAVLPWILVDSTPAGAAQIGLNDFFADRGPIDLVVSGPNYGRNTSAVFALSSGTLGAALEAAVCGYRAIALSFAFTDRLNRPEIVAQSCRQSVRVVEWLFANATWDDAQLYSVNVPVRDGVEKTRVLWTRMLQNQWSRNACFREMSREDATKTRDPNVEEVKVRAQEADSKTQVGSGGEESSSSARSSSAPDKYGNRYFKWQPRFDDVYKWVEKAGPGSDGWVVKEGETSITAIKANFMHVDGYEGEVKL